jgi:hypothetical protein
MKQLRKLSMLALILIFVMNLTGCVVIPLPGRYYDYDPATIETAEIYDLRSEYMEDSSFLETDLPVCTVPEEQKAEFVAEIGKIEFKMYILIVLGAVDPSFYYGDWAVRLNRTDGSYVLLSDGGYVEIFDENGEHIEFRNYDSIDRERWNALLEAYVPQEILQMSPDQNITPVDRR